MSLTPNQLRQLRETIETLATIAEGNSTATETVNHAGTALLEPRPESRQISPVTASVTVINNSPSNSPQRIATYTNAPNSLPLTGGPPQPQDAGTAGRNWVPRQRLSSVLQPATTSQRDASAASASSSSNHSNVGQSKLLTRLLVVIRFNHYGNESVRRLVRTVFSD